MVDANTCPECKGTGGTGWEDVTGKFHWDKCRACQATDPNYGRTFSASGDAKPSAGKCTGCGRAPIECVCAKYLSKNPPEFNASAEHVQTSDVSWDTCRKGSCHRHQACMYSPCLSSPPTDTDAPESAREVGLAERKDFKSLYHDKMRESEIEQLARDMCADPDIRAPVQGYPGGIPWEMHMRAYMAYAKKWSKQVALINLYGRGCRGGFGITELDELIPGWRDELSERTALLAQVATLTARCEALERALRKAQAFLNDPDGGTSSQWMDAVAAVDQALSTSTEEARDG